MILLSLIDNMSLSMVFTVFEVTEPTTWSYHVPMQGLWDNK